jgi:hypothetical protein
MRHDILGDMIEADAALLKKIDREVKGTRPRAADVEEALKHVSKQFQLWDVTREVRKDEAARFEKIEGLPGPAIDAAGPRFEQVLFESTRAIAQFVAASSQAKKAFTGFRALKRIVLRKPYKPAG